MSIAAINGTTLYYEELGSGPVCLVLHGGLGLDHTLYRDLDALAGRVRLVYYDQRGNGRSGRPPLATLTMPQLADDAAALADRLGADRMIVVGHSYGGFVAQELALRHPDRVAGLVLVDTTPGQLGDSDRPGDDQGPPVPEELAAAMSSAPPTDADMAEGMRPLLRHYLHRLSPEDVAPRFADVVFDAAAMSRSMEVLAGWSAADRLPAVTAPTLILVGRHDVVTAPAQAHRIARRIAGAHVVEFDHSGHFPWLDQPDEFFAVLGAWLDELAAGTGAGPGMDVADTLRR
jgi:proline iminopeptidase